MTHHLPLHHEAFLSLFIDQIIELSPWREQQCASTLPISSPPKTCDVTIFFFNNTDHTNIYVRGLLDPAKVHA